MIDLGPEVAGDAAFAGKDRAGAWSERIALKSAAAELWCVARS